MHADLRRLIGSEPVRFLLAGVWNSFFGWAVFSATWLLLREATNLWVISAIAHLVATSQAFLVQRHLVFRQTAQAVWRQFLKFQLAYFILLGVGALIVNALSAQQVHPLLAQLIGMALLAVCGFVLGKSFTFNPAALEWAALVRRLGDWSRSNRLALVSFSGAMLLFEFCWGGRFYADQAPVGHDFALTGIGLLEGKFWIDANGVIAGLFNPPWFTPAWCAGTAFYADPQSAFYSPLQWFALWVDPFQATHLNALLFAAVAFWGSHALARRVLNWNAAAATVFALLGIANNFLPLRSAVGEAGYQPLYVWTLLALSLCWPLVRNRAGTLVWPSIGVGLCLTAWLQFGFAGMMVPAFLATLAFCFALVLFGRARLWPVLGRAALGGVLAIVLNGSKLYESGSFMKNFPRDFYSMPGFPSLQDAFTSIGLALIQPSEWTAFFGLRRMTGMHFTVFPHEWALSFGLGALVMALTFGATLLYWRRGSAAAPFRIAFDASQWLALGAMLIILAIPPLLLWNQGALRAVIKQIPILNSAAWPMRWIVLYLPLMQLLLALPAASLANRIAAPRAWMIAATAFLLIWFGPLMEPVSYYTDRSIQNYDPKPVVQAFERSRTEGAVAIDQISAVEADLSLVERNDSMLRGVSQGYCYNPIYGYRLEGFPQIGRLKSGPALSVDESGQSLLFKPACLVHPAENTCTPGSGFRMNEPLEQAQAQKFLARRPFEWRRSALGAALSWISQGCFWILLTLIALRAWQTLLQMARPITARDPEL